MGPPDSARQQHSRCVDRTLPVVPCRPVDVILAIILVAAAIVSLLFLGASNAIARFALEATLATVIVIWACDGRRSPTTLLLPLGICGLVLLQIVPLPDWLLVRIAPISGGAWKVAQAGTPGAWGRISIDPAATAASARRLLLGAGSFLVVRDLAVIPGIRRGLTASLAGSAALIWALGLWFPRDTKDDLLLGFVNLAGPIYFWVSPILAPIQTAGAADVNLVTVGRWRYPVADGLVGDGFGPFIGSNQFAGAMCLLLPFLLAFWVVFARNRLPAWCDLGGTVAISAAAAWTSGIRAGSRAGAAALVLGFLAFLALTAQPRWWRRTTAVTAVLAAAALVVLAAMAFGLFPGYEALVPERFRDDLARLFEDNRSIGIRVGLRMVRASPVAGTGLDSYADVFPLFEPSRGTFFYAHNDYVQWIAETGLIGGLVAAVFAFIIIRRGCAWFGLQQGTERILAAGVAAAAIGFACHEFFEWNLHLPAIALVASIVAGIATPSECRNVTGSGGTASTPRFARLRIPASIALVVVVIAATYFLARDMATERTCVRLRTALAADRLARLDPKQPPPVPAMEAAVMAGVEAIPLNPANADLPLLLGQLHLHLAAHATREADRDALEQTAQEWVTKARHRRAICFGLPEPIVSAPTHPTPSSAARPLGQ